MKAIYGLYPNPDAAQRAFDSLLEAKMPLGFSERDILVLSSEPFDHYGFGRRDTKTHMPWIAAVVGILGGLAGYWLLTFTQNAYPLPTGGMRIAPMWTDGIIIYECAMFGAILATFAALLLQARLPRWKHLISDPAVSDGNILVGVADPREESRPALDDKLRAAGASVIKNVT
jgi:Alternative complex III, ActD subunit